jgi:hypothetical protein
MDRKPTRFPGNVALTRFWWRTFPRIHKCLRAQKKSLQLCARRRVTPCRSPLKLLPENFAHTLFIPVCDHTLHPTSHLFVVTEQSKPRNHVLCHGRGTLRQQCRQEFNDRVRAGDGRSPAARSSAAVRLPSFPMSLSASQKPRAAAMIPRPAGPLRQRLCLQNR